eukprot:2266815-Lingulodinium_polyedra.AAC.1
MRRAERRRKTQSADQIRRVDIQKISDAYADTQICKRRVPVTRETQMHIYPNIDTPPSAYACR